MRSEIVAVVKDRQRLSALVPIDACRSGVQRSRLVRSLAAARCRSPGKNFFKTRSGSRSHRYLSFLIARR